VDRVGPLGSDDQTDDHDEQNLVVEDTTHGCVPLSSTYSRIGAGG
jgi:hypothetical protein